MSTTPVVLGTGVVSQRMVSHHETAEPLELMIVAAKRAVDQADVDPVLIESVYVPRGRWSYENPAGAVARAIGATSARTVVADVGVLQQSLIGDACARVASGADRATLVVGGEAGHRLNLYAKAGLEAPESAAPGQPDVYLRPQREIRIDEEFRVGLGQRAVGFYACLENAYRARRGRGIAEHDRKIAELYARFSEIAATNKEAWFRTPVSADEIATPSDRNPRIAFPYNRLHVSSWSVDQSAALLFGADDLSGSASRPAVYVRSSSESNHMVPISKRADLADLPAAGIAGRAALEAAQLTVDDIDLFEIYSCFPIAVEMYADELGVAPDRDFTVCGGMPFAGGPFNNFVLQSTAKAVELIREGKGATALVTSVSGVLTKQGFGVYANSAAERPFASIDVSAEVASVTDELDIESDYCGLGTVVGYTVIHDRGKPARAVVIAQTSEGCRALAFSENDAEIQTAIVSEGCGRRVAIEHGQFVFLEGETS